MSDVAALKLTQARTVGNPAVAAALFPDAPWVSEFQTWAAANPDSDGVYGFKWPNGEPWTSQYLKWYGELMAGDPMTARQ